MKRETDPLKLAPEALCTVRQAAVIANVSEVEMRRALRDDVIDHVYVGGQPRIPRFSIKEWIEGRLKQDKTRLEQPVRRILRMAK